MDIATLRKDFNNAIDDPKKAATLYELFNKQQPSTNTLQYAYWGATEALMAKHVFNPFSKMSYVKAASIKLNNAIEMNKEDIEVRYMRFSIETELPAYLGYSKHLNEDKTKLINGLSKVELKKSNQEMYRTFATGLIKSKRCNNQEVLLLKEVINRCNQVQ